MAYSDLPEPDRADHLWRYTPWHRIHPTGTVAEVPEAGGAKLSLRSLDGSTEPAGFELIAAEAADIARLAPNGADDVSTQFIRDVAGGQAVILRVARKAMPSQPVILEVEAAGDVCALHLLIDIGELAEFELITKVRGDAGWFGMLRSGRVGDAAIVNDIVVNQVGEGHLLRTDAIRLGRDAQVKAGAISSGGSRCKADLRFILDTPGASLSVNGSILSSGEQHNDHHVEIHHTAPSTQSRLEWHSACADASRTIGTGMLRIDRGANGADAGQLFHNLLLSDKAEADSIPELEVSEHDVVGCGHGTANGPVDDEQMFYLKTRGFDEAQARAALIAAFLNATLTEMGSEVVHDHLLRELNDDLADIC